jgi:hypothetical protein
LTGPPNYLDPDDPAPDQVAESLSGWHTLRLEAVWETLTRSDLDFAWDHDDQLVFHAPDRHAVTAVLDRFRDAPLHEIDEVLDRYGVEDDADEQAF